jgi:hypothetical protein
MSVPIVLALLAAGRVAALPAQSQVCRDDMVSTVTNDTRLTVDVWFTSPSGRTPLGSVGPGGQLRFIHPSEQGTVTASFSNPSEAGGPGGSADIRRVRVSRGCSGEWVTLSPRETVRGAVGGATVTIEYGRPSQNSRTIWGELVPWGKVWRLGADRATELNISADLRIGDAHLPAGTYSLWMLPSQSGQSMLIINRQTRILGSRYRDKHDVVRIPVARSTLDPPVERLTIAVEGDRLWIRWSDLAWSVAIDASGLIPPRPTPERGFSQAGPCAPR